MPVDHLASGQQAAIGQKHSFNIGLCFTRLGKGDLACRDIAPPQNLSVENSDASLNATIAITFNLACGSYVSNRSKDKEMMQARDAAELFGQEVNSSSGSVKWTWVIQPFAIVWTRQTELESLIHPA
ncbi:MULTISPECIES: hypothetical protein [unclassified Pseudomonas]|uniref:hypothetical protein n=1 Tax=unclassified Pseudomonas TaxID=196821 RepID=UPI000C883F23|nr:MULTISPECIES: hypothetical protein [unclassified Pseudomonas]PMZ91392.1 hypothetical protein C1X61_05375 [Pseudomonas sp. FW215-T2]PNA14608.1 hypothetical protein C1X62_06755 [Pseudomonas sp. FW215-R3]PNB38585.1 hypothetical protein C1X63_07200 [Pseudomonas sp. FW305-131]